MAACVSDVAIAQFNSGIQGLVTDSSGAVVPEATIHVTNTSTGVSRNAVTSAEGLYRILSLGPGSYVASAEARGFRTSSRPNIELSTNETVRVDFALQIGDVSETVAVVDRPPEVETEQGRFSGLIARQELNDL